ncbi:sugar ABC transporter ATP-binding protein [Propionivibrio soli]|uniref:sugar ABC transporter ATP-binding protein n=1 Tax=Propionivibrio soli TaxID=2976531 RepID=UPI0021E89700
MQEYVLELSGISKSFPGVKALDDVHFNLKAGEVHALLGENGAGKSTLMKIISGIYNRDSGSYRLNGLEIGELTPKKAQELGIAIIHQELNMCTDLTVAENMFLGREMHTRGVVRQTDMNRMAKAMLDKLKIDIDPRTVVKKLPVSKQQMVEIAKALSTNARILIMDEPTSALTEREITELFRIVRDLREQGCAIIYISHRLDELKEITDRVSIFRDGRYVATRDFAETTLDEIISMMVGREIKEKFPHVAVDKGRKILEVSGLSSGMVRDVSFSLYAGEIIGLAGLMGAGRTELVRAIFGADPVESGTITLDGETLSIRHPMDAIRHGIVLGPEDRKKEGLCTELSIRENIGLANLDSVCNRWGVVRSGTEKDLTQRAIRDLRIRTPSEEQTAKNLSGGNQQKVVLGKWLVREAKVVIFDEPTRGIDVASKVEIYTIMNELKAKGIGVLFVSSEMPEVMGMSDRILVMCNGRITGNLISKETTQDEILRCATQYALQ